MGGSEWVSENFPINCLKLLHSLEESKTALTIPNYVGTGASNLGVFFYDVESDKDDEIRGMRPWLNSLVLINASSIMPDGSPLHNVSSA